MKRSMRPLSLRSVALLCVVLCSNIAAHATAPGKGKKSKKVVVETYDDGLPQPDPLPPSLTPQPELANDFTRQVEEQPRHAANLRIGGIDVSHYQGQINWREVARSKEVNYVYIKATEGAQLVDNTYLTNLRGARHAGLKVGVYHFYRPNVSRQQQFRNMKANVNLRDIDLIPIIDVEHRGREPLKTFQNNLLQFLQMVEQHYGVRPIIYTSRDFYNKHLAGPFTHYKYMIARYHSEVPELCDNAAFVMWQYTANGRVPGIRGNVDRSCFMDAYQMRDILLP